MPKPSPAPPEDADTSVTTDAQSFRDVTAQGGPSRGASGDAAVSDWPARAADLVEEIVGAFRSRVVRPLLVAVRAVSFGLLVATAALVAGVLGSIALVRFLDVYVFDGRVWASDALVGALLCMLGGALWSRRSRRDPSSVEELT